MSHDTTVMFSTAYSILNRYEDNRDADDAIRRRDGYEFAGGRLRVEATRGGGPPRGPGGGAGYTGKRGDHVAIVTGVPQGGSWQDLKDFCRNGGIPNVLFADVNGSEGMVEFANADDLKKAVRDLDDTKFRTHRDESGFVRVKAKNGGGGSRSRSRSRGRDSRSRSRGRDSRSRSPARKESKSRSRSPARKGSRSRSRSRSP